MLSLGMIHQVGASRLKKKISLVSEGGGGGGERGNTLLQKSATVRREQLEEAISIQPMFKHGNLFFSSL